MRNLILLLLVLTFSSCSIFRKRESNKELTSYSKDEKSKVKIDSSKIVTDKTVTTETEKTETVTERPPIKITKENENVSFDDLKNGLQTIDSAGTKATVKYDSASKKLTTQIETLGEKKTEKSEKSKTTFSDKKEEAKASTTNQNKTAVRDEKEIKVVKDEPKGLAWFWLVIIGVVVVLVIGGIVYFKRR